MVEFRMAIERLTEEIKVGQAGVIRMTTKQLTGSSGSCWKIQVARTLTFDRKIGFRTI